MSTSGIVWPFNRTNFLALVGGSRQARYIYEYLTHLGAKTCVIEREYIDKSYMIDYQKFYSRAFQPIPKTTDRVHCFAISFSAKEFEHALEENTELVKELKDEKSYLGFIVVKKIADREGEPLIGRTLLKTFPPKTDSRKRFYLRKGIFANLFGISLEIDSIPFQAQDFGVSACATVALWTALQSLPRHFDVQGYSPAEITELATEFPAQSRMFPQSGLTLGQIINCIRHVGLDVEFIVAGDNEIISTAVKAYTNMGIPMVGALKLFRDGSTARHATVIVGYQHDNKGNLTELYVHDDQIGPFSKVKPVDGDFRFWENEWKDLGYEVQLWLLMVPIYHKVRLPFYHIYQHYQRRKELYKSMNLRMELLLSTVQTYKRSILQEQISEKSERLKENLPRFIWIERTFEREGTDPILDDIFDGTAIRPRKLATIEYQAT